MDSFNFDGCRGRWVAWACTLGLALAACSEAAPATDSKRSGSSESDDDDEDSDDDSDTRPSQSKPDAKVSDPKGAKDAGKSTDSGKTADKPPASGGKDGGTPAASSGGLPCNVAKIVIEKCGGCHNEDLISGAPMKLTAQADFMANGSKGDKTVRELAKERINATSKAMPPPPGKLTADELATLNEWLDDGAQASSEKCTDTPTPGGDNGMDFDRTGLECHKLLAHAAGSKEKYMAAEGETYINFGFKAPWQGKGYMVVSAPSIDNAKVVHHWLLYKENVQDGSVAATIGQHSGELQTGWAPGGKPIDLRKHGSTGVEMEGTYSVEIHYNNNTGAPAADQSGVELCLVKEKPTNVASLSWLGYDQGGTIAYATGICLDPATTWTSTCVPANHTQPIHIINLVPHMHQTGTHMKAVINSPDGSSRVLLDEPFDFNSQVAYDSDEVLMPGETITTTCTFSAPNCAGQSTTQEMCYMYTLHYPAKSLVDFGAEGTLMHGDGVCLGQ